MDLQSESRDVVIEELGVWLKEQDRLPDKISDKMLKIFMSSCMNDIEKTMKTITEYYSLRVNSPEYFSSRDPTCHKLIQASKVVYTLLLPGCTKDGYKVVMIGYYTSDTSQYVYDDVIKLLLMVFDMWIWKHGPIPGFVIIIESQNSTFKHFSAASYDSIKKLFTYFTDALPASMQLLILLNVRPAVNMLLSLLQPLLTGKLRKMIQKFPKIDESFMEIVPKEILPKELGGEGKSLSEMQEDVMKELLDYWDYFKEEDTVIQNLPRIPKRRFFNYFS